MEEALNSGFGELKEYSSSVQRAGVAVQRRMKSNLQNNVQDIFDQVKQSPEAEHLNVKCYIQSLGTPESQNALRICLSMAEFVDASR